MDREVEVKVHYPIPIHLQRCASELGYKRGDFPVTERQAAEVMTIPSHQHLEPAHLKYVVDCIGAFYSRTS